MVEQAVEIITEFLQNISQYYSVWVRICVCVRKWNKLEHH